MLPAPAAPLVAIDRTMQRRLPSNVIGHPLASVEDIYTLRKNPINTKSCCIDP
jgi:hypothetical protein